MNKNREKVNTSLISIKINIVVIRCQIFHSFRHPNWVWVNVHCLDGMSDVYCLYSISIRSISYLIRYGYRKDGGWMVGNSLKIRVRKQHQLTNDEKVSRSKHPLITIYRLRHICSFSMFEITEQLRFYVEHFEAKHYEYLLLGNACCISYSEYKWYKATHLPSLYIYCTS